MPKSPVPEGNLSHPQGWLFSWLGTGGAEKVPNPALGAPNRRLKKRAHLGLSRWSVPFRKFRRVKPDLLVVATAIANAALRAAGRSCDRRQRITKGMVLQLPTLNLPFRQPS